MALGINGRRVTADVHAIFSDEAVAEEVRAMAAERDLDPGWLNRLAAMFLPDGPDPDALTYSSDGIEITLASPEHVLAMKMASYRPGKDQEHLEILFRRLDIATPEEAADLALAIYGDASVVAPGREELILSARAVLDRMKETPRGPGSVT